jgi:hypothetical protein
MLATVARGGTVTVLTPAQAFPRDMTLVLNVTVNVSCPAMSKDTGDESLVVRARLVNSDAGLLPADGLELNGVRCTGGGGWKLLDAAETAAVGAVAVAPNGRDPLYTRASVVLAKTNTFFPNLYVLHGKAKDVDAPPKCSGLGGLPVPVSRFVLLVPAETGYLSPLDGVGEQVLISEGREILMFELGDRDDGRCIWVGDKLLLDPLGVGSNAGNRDAGAGVDGKGVGGRTDGGNGGAEKLGIGLGVLGIFVALGIVAVGAWLWRRRGRGSAASKSHCGVEEEAAEESTDGVDVE